VRRLSSSSKYSRTLGLRATSPRKTARSSLRASASLLARTVACRGPSRMRPISPKVSPGPKVLRVTSSPSSPAVTARARPETMM
jgi:hypothetical protein